MLALGADAVLVGRAPLWGLALGRERGVSQILKRLNEELVLPTDSSLIRY